LQVLAKFRKKKKY